MIVVIVNHKPVSTNMMYRTPPVRRGGRNMYMTKVGKTFKFAVTTAAFAAAVKANWKMTTLPVHVSLTFCNTRADVDGCVKPVLDALQGILFENDRQVKKLDVTKTTDDQGPRVWIGVSLL